MPEDAMVSIENVNTPGRTSRVNARKYSAMREILLTVLPTDEPGLTQAEMAVSVAPHLPQDLWPHGKKSMWWLKTVQLDLEARGLVIRDPSSRPRRWRRT